MKSARLPLALLVALAAALAFGIDRCNAVGDARATLEREREVSAAEIVGARMALRVAQRDLDKAVNDNASLREYAAKLKKAGIKAHPVATFSGTTGPVQIQPGVTITVGGAGAAQAPQAASAAPAPGLPSPGAGGPTPCKSGEILIPAGAVWVTEKGNVTATTRGEAWCAEPRALLFAGPVKADVSTLQPPRSGRGPGWGSGVTIVGGRGGWSVGPTIAAPPLSVLGLQVEPSAAFTLGGGGQWSAVGTVIVRRSP